jgi:hypothetical protein
MLPTSPDVLRNIEDAIEASKAALLLAKVNPSTKAVADGIAHRGIRGCVMGATQRYQGDGT